MPAPPNPSHSSGNLPDANRARLPWRALADSLQEGVMLVNDRLDLKYFNEAARSLFGLDKHTDLSSGRFCDKTLAVLRIALENADAGNTVVRNYSRRLSDGDSQELEGFFCRLEETGDLLAVLRNLSPLKKVEAALLQSQKNQAIGSLAAGIAHDFNNILTALLSQLELAQMVMGLPQAARDNIEQAQISGRRAAELVNRLLTFSRQAPDQKTVIDLAEVIDQVLLILRRSFKRNIRIEYDGVEAGQHLIEGDGGQMMQVVLNLCLNARDAMPEGGVLTIELKQEGSAGGNAGVLLTVRDNGKGIPEDRLNRVFEPYYTTGEIHRGTGLGLTIVQNIVQEHGGRVEVDSTMGRGTSFRVFLPRASSPSGRSAGLQSFTESETKALEGKEHILVVDDEEMVRMVIKAVLSFRGYRISEAADGEEMLRKFEETPEGFDLTLLDLDMPKMNGWEALKQLRTTRPEAKLILLSGGSVASDEDLARARGATGFLAKPFKNEKLIQVVRSTLDRHE